MVAPLPKNKSVQFAVDLCSYHEGAVLDIDYVRETDVWYQMDELKYIKLEALKRSRDKNSMVLGSLLSSTYGRFDLETVEVVNLWVSSCESLRGLERFVNNDFGEKRACARRRTINVVLTAQHKMRTDDVRESEYIETVLGRLSESFSQDYVRFAAILGQADMLVVSPGIDAYCVDDHDFADCQKIEPNKIVMHDAIFKTPSRSMRTRKATSHRVVNRSSLHRGNKNSPSNAQRDFIEMRFCF